MPQNSGGPFDAFLTPANVQPTFQPPQQGLTGYEHKGGIIANLATSFLGGLSKGRAQQQQRTDMERANQLGSVNNSIAEIENSQLPPDVKQKQLADLYEMRHHLFTSSLDDAEGGGGKGKSKNPVIAIARQMSDSLLGKKDNDGKLDPEQMKAKMYDISQTLKQAPQLAAKNMEAADAPLRSVLAKYTDKNGQVNTGQMLIDKDFGPAVANNLTRTGGQGSPFYQQVQGIGREQAYIANINSQAQLRLDQEKRAEAAIKVAFYKTPPGREETLRKYNPELIGTPEGKAFIADGGRLPRGTATQFGIQLAWDTIKKIKNGEIGSDDPRAEWAQGLIESQQARTDEMKARAQASRANIELRAQNLNLAGIKAANEVTEKFRTLNLNVLKDLGDGKLTKEAAQEKIDEQQKDENAAITDLEKANKHIVRPKKGSDTPKRSEADLRGTLFGASPPPAAANAPPQAKTAPPPTGTMSDFSDSLIKGK